VNATAASALRAAQPAQNWILDPVQDTIFIIAAPLITLTLALLTFHFYGPMEATGLIVVVHTVFTVAHHLPTFIRIYGDVELFRRFKWSFLLGPLIPFTFALGVLGYLNDRALPLENFFYIWIILTLWDPWHFMRQHYGFMRIYDRHNAAGKTFGARFDFALSAVWFAYIMAASSEWLPGVLEGLYTTTNMPVLLFVPQGGLEILTRVLAACALLTTVAYTGYLVWCWHKGYFVSLAKLTMVIVMFGVMYLTYTPNEWMLSLAPGWSFKVGFAVIGIVHMSQYLAIVWRYNRSLASKDGKARTGWFRKMHARGGFFIAAGYVLLCLSYGEVLTVTHDNRWLMSVLLALGFTSTLMHYYFDGFIWRVRHRQNLEHLLSDDGQLPAQLAMSWWSSANTASAAKIFSRQLLYFAVPMTVFTVGALSLWNGSAANYLQHMYSAYLANQRGESPLAVQEAHLAFDDMERQLPAARKLAEIQPTSAHDAELAYLIYNHAQYAYELLPTLNGQRIDVPMRALDRQDVLEAIATLERALAKGGSLAYPGRDQLTSDDGYAALRAWRKRAMTLTLPSPASGRG